MSKKNAGCDGERGLDVAEFAVVVVRVDDLRGAEAPADEVTHACRGIFELLVQNDDAPLDCSALTDRRNRSRRRATSVVVEGAKTGGGASSRDAALCSTSEMS